MGPKGIPLGAISCIVWRRFPRRGVAPPRNDIVLCKISLHFHQGAGIGAAEDAVHQTDHHGAVLNMDVIVGVVLNSQAETLDHTGMGSTVVELDAFQYGSLADHGSLNHETSLLCAFCKM